MLSRTAKTDRDDGTPAKFSEIRYGFLSKRQAGAGQARGGAGSRFANAQLRPMQLQIWSMHRVQQTCHDAHTSLPTLYPSAIII